MKYTILSILVGSLLLAGCGGSDNNNSNNSPKDNGGQGTQNPSTPLTTALINQMSGIALREALLSGLVDTLISGTDDVKDGAQCKTGSMTRNGNLIHFDQCTGLYEDSENAKVSGDIDLSNSNYSYKDFTLSFPDSGETQKINGVLKLSINEPVRSVKSTQIVLDMQALNSAKKLIPVNYTFTDYNLVWTSSDATHVQLQISTKLKSTGAEGGDFNMAFDNFMNPFDLQKDAEDNLVGYPSAGTLTVYDLNQSKNKITIKAMGVNQPAQYTSEGDQIFDKPVTWSDLLSY